jgi:protein TonB
MTRHESIQALEWEDQYYARALRVATALALIVVMAAFLVLPKEFLVQPYQLRRSVETIMEALPPELQTIAEPPKVERPATVPVAAQNEAEVEVSTIAKTDFVEVIKRTDETDIPVVAFWKVEVKPQPINIPVPDYPEMARQATIEGQTVVEALVDVDGSIVDARVLKSSGNQSLDASAISAARRARFTPAKQRDMPVRVWVSIPFRFSLH